MVAPSIFIDICHPFHRHVLYTSLDIIDTVKKCIIVSH